MEENNKKLTKRRQASNDRAQTIEEIRKLIKYQDRRIKPIVCTMFSSGIQLGTWDFLQWKHIIPVTEENEKKLFLPSSVFMPKHRRILHFHYF